MPPIYCSVKFIVCKSFLKNKTTYQSKQRLVGCFIQLLIIGAGAGAGTCTTFHPTIEDSFVSPQPKFSY